MQCQGHSGQKKAGQVSPVSVRGWLLPWLKAHALRLRQAYQERGVRDMYPWQAAALECGEGGGNLVYCAPTSGGKSLVAEVLLLRRQPQQAPARAQGARHHPLDVVYQGSSLHRGG